MTISLRDYQEETLAAIKAELAGGKKKICVYAPTGAGKTIMFCAIAMRAIQKNPKVKVLIVVDRVVLLNQTVNKLVALGIRPQVLYNSPEFADYHKPSNVFVTSIQTLNNKLKKDPMYLPTSVKLIVVDECHHSYVSPSAPNEGQYAKLFQWAHENKTVVLGFTATPERLSKKQSLSQVYETLVQSASFMELRSQNYLCKWQVYSQPSEHLAQQLAAVGMSSMGDYEQKGLGRVMASPDMVDYTVAQWLKLSAALGRQPSTISFTVTIEHSKALEEAFLQQGVSAVAIDCETPFHIRELAYKKLAKGDITVLISVGVLTEGFDVPSVECCLMVRPTASKGLYIQQFGRVLRTAPNKKTAYILDLTANYATHGCPTLYTPEEAFYKSASTRGKKEAPIKECPNCKHKIPAQARECPECGYRFPIKFIEFCPTEAALINVVATLDFQKFQSITTTVGFLQNYIVRALNRGYNLDWASMQFKTKFNRFPTKKELDHCLFGKSPTPQQEESFLQAVSLIAKEKGKTSKWVKKWVESQTNLTIDITE